MDKEGWMCGLKKIKNKFKAQNYRDIHAADKQ